MTSTSMTCHCPPSEIDVDARRTEEAPATRRPRGAASSASTSDTSVASCDRRSARGSGSRRASGVLRTAWVATPSTRMTETSPLLDPGRVLLHQHVAVVEQVVEMLLPVRGRRPRSGRRPCRRLATAGFTTTVFHPCASAMPSSAAALPRGSSTVGTRARRGWRVRAGTPCACSTARARAGSRARLRAADAVGPGEELVEALGVVPRRAQHGDACSRPSRHGRRASRPPRPRASRADSAAARIGMSGSGAGSIAQVTRRTSGIAGVCHAGPWFSQRIGGQSTVPASNGSPIGRRAAICTIASITAASRSSHLELERRRPICRSRPTPTDASSSARNRGFSSIRFARSSS